MYSFLLGNVKLLSHQKFPVFGILKSGHLKSKSVIVR